MRMGWPMECIERVRWNDLKVYDTTTVVVGVRSVRCLICYSLSNFFFFF